MCICHFEPPKVDGESADVDQCRGEESPELDVFLPALSHSEIRIVDKVRVFYKRSPRKIERIDEPVHVKQKPK
jgi:hypothetical protein